MSKYIEWLGWYGAGAVLLAYSLISFKVVSSDNVLFQLLNLSGAIGVGWLSFYKRAFQPAILNVAWGTIALFALLQMAM